MSIELKPPMSKPANWRLEKAKQRQLSYSGSSIDLPERDHTTHHDMGGINLLQEEEELALVQQTQRREVKSRQDFLRRSPKIPLPRLPSGRAAFSAENSVPIEDVVKDIVNRSSEEKIQAITHDFENLKKISRSSKQYSISSFREQNVMDNNDDDDERQRALRRHSTALSVLSNASSKRSSIASSAHSASTDNENQRISFVSMDSN